jgi:hypothetical protein
VQTTAVRRGKRCGTAVRMQILMSGEGGGVALCSTADGRPCAVEDDVGVRIHDGLASITIAAGMEMAGSAKGDRGTEG